jgi:hypothetical protein
MKAHIATPINSTIISEEPGLLITADEKTYPVQKAIELYSLHN